MAIIFRFVVLTGFLILSITSGAFAQEITTVRRAAIDIGSAAIKCTVADVDIISGNIIKIVDDVSLKVDFAEDMARSYDGNFSKEILEKGMNAIKEIKSLAQKAGATDFSAVGGASFRNARNGKAYFATITLRTGIPTRIISKQQASLLTYHALAQREKIASANVLVWDIGGASMEMTARNRDKSLTFYVDPLASIRFKNTVIEAIQKKNIVETTTPNPMSEADTLHALTYAQTYAGSHFPHALATRIEQGTLHVFGIGGVHYYSIPTLTGTEQEPYSQADLEKAIEKWTNKPDAAFESEYANTRLTNAILVLGYMKALGIETVTPRKVNQADGLLVAPEFW